MEIRRTPFEAGTRLELMDGDKSVSRLFVFDLRMNIGGAWARCGGIGGVETSRDHRMHGCGRRLLEESVTWMRQEGYHLSALFGIPNFYYRFGYAPGLVESEASVATRQAETAPRRYAVRIGAAAAHRENILLQRLKQRRAGAVVVRAGIVVVAIFHE